MIRIVALIPALLVAANVLAAEPAPSTAPAPVEEKRICRSSLETGSLIKKRKTCLTRSQWRYVDDAHSDEVRRMQLENTNKQSGEGGGFGGG